MHKLKIDWLIPCSLYLLKIMGWVMKLDYTNKWIILILLLITSFVSKKSEACTRAAPTVTIQPAYQAGASGQTLSYNAIFKNNDTSDCGPSMTRYSLVLPSGLSGKIEFPKIWQGPSSSHNPFTISSSTSLKGGLYDFKLKVEIVSGSSGKIVVYSVGYGLGKYAVADSVNCALTTPSLSIPSYYFLKGGVGITTHYSAIIKNNDAIGCKSSTFNLSMVSFGDRFIVEMSNPIVTLAPQESMTVDIAMTPTSSALYSTSAGYGFNLYVKDPLVSYRKTQGYLYYVVNP